MSGESSVIISKIDHERQPMRGALYEYLAPREGHALFILGNLTSRFPEAHLYVAERAGQWLGVAGYYTLPKSFIPFSNDPQIARALARHVADIHSAIEWVNGIGYAARPAYEELLAMGYQPLNDPRQVYMELALPMGKPFPVWPHEERVRLMRSDDAPQVARLIRYLHPPDDGSPPTEDELARARRNPDRLVLEADGRIVSIASTNGLGLRAFQILGVITHADHRRKGYASAVCAALIRLMQKRGAGHCVIFTDAANTAAQKCYERLGFTVTGDYCVAHVQPPLISPPPVAPSTG